MEQRIEHLEDLATLCKHTGMRMETLKDPHRDQQTLASGQLFCSKTAWPSTLRSGEPNDALDPRRPLRASANGYETPSDLSSLCPLGAQEPHFATLSDDTEKPRPRGPAGERWRTHATPTFFGRPPRRRDDADFTGKGCGPVNAPSRPSHGHSRPTCTRSRIKCGRSRYH